MSVPSSRATSPAVSRVLVGMSIRLVLLVELAELWPDAAGQHGERPLDDVPGARFAVNVAHAVEEIKRASSAALRSR